MRLDKFMAESLPSMSRSAVTLLIRAGVVELNGRRGRPADIVREGDSVTYEMLATPETTKLVPEQIPLQVMYEDADLLVIDKPAGMTVHPSAGHQSGTLVHALLGRGGGWSTIGGEARPGIVHRLDKGTSGLLIVARNDAAHRALSQQLSDRTLSRTYLAVVRGVMEHDAGVLEGDVGRDPSHRQRMAVVAHGRFARTRYMVMERLRSHTLLRCDLETGRTHQVRVHLAALGHPIAGDDQYARRRPDEPSRPMLHAWRLRFMHPRTGEEMSFEAEPPADFVTYIESIGSRGTFA